MNSTKRKHSPDPSQPSIDQLFKKSNFANGSSAKFTASGTEVEVEMEGLMKAMKDGFEKCSADAKLTNDLVATIDLKLNVFENKISKMEVDILNNKTEIEALKKQLKSENSAGIAPQLDIIRMENCVRKLDFLQRKHNIIIRGLKEESNETIIQLKSRVTELLSDLNLLDSTPNAFRRIGGAFDGKDRPVRLQFDDIVKRDKVWSTRFQLRHSRAFGNVYIDGDFPPDVLHQRFMDRQLRKKSASCPPSNEEPK